MSEELRELRLDLKNRLVEYLQQECGINVAGRRKFRCPNPAHRDSDPSCVVYQNTGGQHIICNGCDLSGDIFSLHSRLTGAAVNGPSFVTDNLFVLAKMFGLPIPESKDDTFLSRVRRAYKEAERTLMSGQGSELVEKKLSSLGWPEKVRTSLGIGSVDFWKYRKAMTENWDIEFLESIQLLDPKLFGKDLLTFTVRNEFGDPVGFSARNLHYEQAKEVWKKACETFGEESAEATARFSEIPPKYYNSRQGGKSGSPILNKGERIFGFHVARASAGPLYLVEGYPDVATAHSMGIPNCGGLSSASLTVQQLELILKYKIPHVVLCLDADEGGRRGISTTLKMMEEVSIPDWFMMEIMILPEGTDDPDAFLRRSGKLAFESQTRCEDFEWRLKELVQSTTSRQDLYNKVTAMLKADKSSLKRWLHAETASRYLGVPGDILYREASEQKDVASVKITIVDGKPVMQEEDLYLLSQYPYRLIDCRANITIDRGNSPDLYDDIYYR